MRPSINILLRVDGSDQLGMGHVMRCLSLARELARSTTLEPVFVMRAFDLGTRWVAQQGHEVVPLPADLAPREEAERLSALIRERQALGVITDLRTLPSGLLDAVHAAGALCVVIDEWGRRAIRADLLTNGTIVPAWHHYELEGTVRCCIGPRFALLEPQFAELHERPRVSGTGPPRVLAAMGGDDPFFLTAKILRALERIPRALEVTAVVGPAFTNGEEIERLAAASRHRATVRRNVSDMAELMAGSDVALAGGGLVALELACVGTPGFIVCEVSHQLETAAALEREGAAVSLGFGVAVPEEEIAREAAALLDDDGRRARMSASGRRLIDGRGCARIAEAILDGLRARGHLDERQAAAIPLGR